MDDDESQGTLTHDGIARKAAADIQNAFAERQAANSKKISNKIYNKVGAPMAQQAREAAANRTQRSVGYAPGQLHTKDERASAYKQLTDED